MRLVSLNGSLREKWNTGQLLDKVVEGAQGAGMDAKLVHLYDLAFGACEIMISNDTLQFDDYCRYEIGMFDSAAKQQWRRDIFPQDERRAFGLGRRVATAPAP